MGYTKYTFDKDFFKKDTPDSFYVAGFIAADGWIYDKLCKNKQHYEVGLSLKEADKSHIEKIQSVMKSNHKLYKRIVKNSKRDPKYNDTITYTLLIYSPEYIDDLKRFGIISNKSLIYKMPEWIKDHQYVNNFLAGYFDGDGSISFDRKRTSNSLRKTPQARLHIRGTSEFLKDFHNILFKNCDLPTQNKIISTDSGIGSIQYTGNNNVNSILNFLYKDGNFMQRKYERFLELHKIMNEGADNVLS